MKYQNHVIESETNGSLPVRGAWVEITKRPTTKNEHGRSPCGERGLKYQSPIVTALNVSRSPCGERGLKYGKRFARGCKQIVAPRAGSVG